MAYSTSSNGFHRGLGVLLAAVGLYIGINLLSSIRRSSGEVIKIEATFKSFEKIRETATPYFDPHRGRAKNYNLVFHGIDSEGKELSLFFPGETLNTTGAPLREGQAVVVSTNEQRHLLLALEKNGVPFIDSGTIQAASGSRRSLAGLMTVVLIVAGFLTFIGHPLAVGRPR